MATYTPIASITLGSSASSVTFSSIPQDYRDLILVANFEQDTQTSAAIRVNNITTTSYDRVAMTGDGSALSGGGAFNLFFLPEYNTNPNEEVNAIVQFMDYSATDKHKTLLFREGSKRVGGNRQTTAKAGRVSTTTAITEIDIFARLGNLTAGSTFALYGIEA